jgi:hypothetical protein
MSKADSAGFRVEVQAARIVVSFPGTTFCVVYLRPMDERGLLASGFSKEVNATSAQIAGFLSVARDQENKKAKELGWMT